MPSTISGRSPVHTAQHCREMTSIAHAPPLQCNNRIPCDAARQRVEASTNDDTFIDPANRFAGGDCAASSGYRF
jgi:hypothetical protein